MKDLHELRKRCGLTLDELSKRTGMGRQKLFYAERGVHLQPGDEGKILAVIEETAEENYRFIVSFMEEYHRGNK